ncbi:MAG: Gfo/Idh/MocA family oxidoreductase [Bacteroidota bacterium]
MTRIGLLGAGHLGKIHLRLLKEIETVELVGFFDLDPDVRSKVSETYSVPTFDTYDALLEQVEAVDIVTPTTTHFEMAQKALQLGKHIFIEKPLTQNPKEALDLISLVKEKGVVAQVGHVERFNPAFLTVGESAISPMFIEGHRLAQYNPRGTDVSVVLDLMIHDLDVVLSLVNSPVQEISASGVAVISDSPDIANARIEFENGCVANLTASRISVKNMRRLRMFQKNTYLVVDFLEKKAETFKITEEPPAQGAMRFDLDSGKKQKYLIYESPEVQPVNSIKMELEEFVSSIETGSRTRVSIEDGYKALQVAHEIIHRIEEKLEKVK